MDRRRFILGSSSAVFSGFAVSSLNRPVVGLDFELSYTNDKYPAKIDSLLVGFETLEVTPKYLDNSEDLFVQTELDVGFQTTKSDKVQTSFTNGEKKELKDKISPMIVDGINTSEPIVGEVTVTIDHTDIQDSYAQRFYISESEVLDSLLDHRYLMNEGSGTKLSDSIGSQPSSLSGGSWLSDSNATGNFKTDHDGNDDYWRTDNAYNLNGQKYSVAVWTYVESSDEFGRIFETISSPSQITDNGYGIELRGTDQRIFVHHYNDGSRYDVTPPDTSVNHTNKWILWCLAADGDDVSFYMYDSSGQVYSNSTTASRGQTDQQYLLGMAGGSRYVNGQVDDLMISTSKKLTESEFDTIWNETKR